MSSDIEITSLLPVPEALNRLRQRVGGDLPLLMMPTSHPTRLLRGWVSDQAFAVRLRTAYGNSFAAVCHGTIEPAGSGSVLRADVGMPGATLAFAGLWVLVVISMGIQGLVGDDLETALTAGGMLLFGAVLLVVGRLLARREAREIVEQLRDVLQPTTDPPAP